MSINLELYKSFLSVAKAHSFSKAAEQSFVSQPAISQSIKQLEIQLNTQLFVRTQRGVNLTEEGELLFHYIENALGLITKAENCFFELQALERGTLKIGASDTLCRHYLLPHLSEFHEKYPSVNMQVTNRTSHETIGLLRAGTVDIGFVNMPTDMGGDISYEPLAKIQDCFVYGEKYFNLFEMPISLQELSKHRLIMLEKQSSTRRYFDNFAKEKAINITPQIELGSLDLLLEFAVSGLGISAVTEEFAEDYISSGKLKVIELIERLPQRSIALVYNNKIPLTFAAKEFLKFLPPNNIKF